MFEPEHFRWKARDYKRTKLWNGPNNVAGSKNKNIENRRCVVSRHRVSQIPPFGSAGCAWHSAPFGYIYEITTHKHCYYFGFLVEYDDGVAPSL